MVKRKREQDDRDENALLPQRYKFSNCEKDTNMSAPIAVVVNVEVKEDRVEEFLQVMEFDAVESRKEEGCLRFDVLRDLADSNKFVFYEVYRDQAAIDFHKSTPHFQKWSEFNESGGVASFSVVRASGLYYTN